MTARYRHRVQCPKCGYAHEAENQFKQWLRNEPALDSVVEGLVFLDCDQIVHRYKFHQDLIGCREIQAMMIIEVKAFNAEPSLAQADTLSILSQVLRNRKDTPTHSKRGRQAENHKAPLKAYSKKLKRKVTVKLFGVHLLQMSDAIPKNSKALKWDGRLITLEVLIRLLRFELDPDQPTRTLDLRRHHENYQPMRLDF